MNKVADKSKAFISKLDKTSVALPKALKDKANSILASLELPTTRNEAWKYTRVAKLGKINFATSKGNISSIDSYTIDPQAPTLVFVNGYFSKSLSNNHLPEGINFTLLSDANEVKSEIPIEDEIFNALNTAHLTDGVALNIAKNTILEKPVQILHILDGQSVMSNFKTRIDAGAFAKAGIIQGYFATEASDKAFANVTTEIEVGENAHLTIDKIQFENETSFHISTEQINQSKDSTFTLNTITLNGGLVRNNLNINVNGENCTSNLNGAYILKGKQHVDNHSVVDHRVANCQSNELYKGVIDDNSTAVFNGKVFVRQDAQQINAFQSNRNVLLSDNAAVNSKPELEIYADDVKCSHGSTTGQLDEDAIFYLRARGLSLKAARQLLVSAFITDVLDKIENLQVKTFTFSLLKERFGWEITPEDFH